MKHDFLLLLATLITANCWAQASYNWNNSPYNFQNSEYNYNNNAYNYYNFNATNGIYDNHGNRIGYETTAPSGVTNVFDNNGNRIGYVPAKP